MIFGFNHDYKYGKRMMNALLANDFSRIGRGCAGLKFLQNTAKSDKYFVLRIANKYKLEFDEESELTQVGTGQKRGLYRVVQFGDLETKTEYRLVTNLPKTGEGAITDEEVNASG